MTKATATSKTQLRFTRAGTILIYPLR
jgi:hypothetical protein